MEKTVVGFGELLLRLSPSGYLKLIQANQFEINYSGAEANVCVSLSNFGIKSQLVTKLPDNDVTKAALATLRKFGVGLDHIVYGGERLGSYYLERGASQRPSKVIYDRKYSAFSMSEPSDYDWDAIFEGAGWLHFSGITAALSDIMPSICEAACKAAKQRGMIISCDLNYRKNLWSAQKAQSVMKKLINMVDIVIGNEEDAEKTLGIAPLETDVTSGKLDYDSYIEVAKRICETFRVRQVAFTLRTSKSASDNTWAAMLYDGQNANFSKSYDIHLVDRVGGGDSFAAGLIYALHTGMPSEQAIEFAVAASCLKQAMEFDFNLSTVEDVMMLMQGDGSGRVQR